MTSGHATVSMSEEQELEKPNFRSSYYVSLGVRAGEQSLISHLEGLIKAEEIGETGKQMLKEWTHRTVLVQI